MNPIEALPATIRIGGYDFRIEKWTHHKASAAQRWGEFSSIEQRISIQSDMPSPEKAVDTFLHEIGHAMFLVYGIADEDKEERIISALGTAWMALHRDNPWLAKWLGKVLA